MTDADLAAQLRALGRAIDWPDQNLVPAVRAAVASAPRPRRVSGLALRPAIITAAVAAVAAVVVVAGTEQGRELVDDWLRVPGVDVTIDETPPTPLVGDPLPAADEVTLAAARSAVDFSVAVPAELGAPDRVYVDQTFPGGVVTQVWAPSDSLPEIASSDVGAMLSTFTASIDRTAFTKVMESLEDVEAVEINGARGIWFGGEPHVVVRDAAGNPRSVTARLSGHTLVWERDGLTYRLETSLGRRATVAIAESLR
jgi:hypothetical protein